ncbi:hypothetical protein C3941_00690 [Kaistia algarum]|uniref:hypothetical protein n=1 Tax=Kaistia algarum TaxID=2083279 RepID=UPI000CE7B4C0|nr:hypothetical protein [Kaistia algarum]MCX5513266.1 hypothetical protein [Kaistia algarum]PPE81274.1 hypothetical protein C3941_00690 [Kaistia algarum]
MIETNRDMMSNAVQNWMSKLENEPGWKEWRRKRFSRTLYFDDPFPSDAKSFEADFVFSEKIEKQHAVILQYLDLQRTIFSLKECEYYFRRYPFRGLPVTRDSHVTNVCEMYFSRFYEFKERMKKYFEAIKAVEPNHGAEFGKFIKHFADEFDQELRARNDVNHRSRFEDIAIDRVFLTGSISRNNDQRGWAREHLVAYRKLVREWSQRVRMRGLKMDEFLEAIAKATLSICTFLETSQPPSKLSPNGSPVG